MADIAIPPRAHTRDADDALAPGVAIAIGVLVAATFTVILNEMLMAVALPRIMDNLGITASTAQWLTTAYMLTMAVVIPATGFLNEQFRMRTVYTLGMSLFLAGTVIAAFSPGFAALLVGRIVQAVGTAIVLPLGFTVVATLVPASRNGRMMAFLTVATLTAPALGPVVAGTVLSLGSWRWLYVLILVVAAVCLVVGNRMLRVPGTPRPAKLDLLSFLLSAVGFASLVYGLASLGEGAGHALVSPWTAMAVGAAGVALFAGRQVKLQKVDRAQLDLRPFAVRTFSVSALVAVFFMTPAAGMMTLMPVVLQTSYGLSPLQTGLFMLPGGLTITFVLIIVGRFYDRMGPRLLMVIGAIIDAAELMVLSTLAPGPPIWLLLATYLFIIVGQALLWTPVFAASLGSLDKHLLPHGSAIINTVQQLAGAAGIAITFSIMAAASAGYVAGGEVMGPAMAHGAQRAYLVCSGLVLVALVMALLIPRKVVTASLPKVAH